MYDLRSGPTELWAWRSVSLHLTLKTSLQSRLRKRKLREVMSLAQGLTVNRSGERTQSCHSSRSHLSAGLCRPKGVVGSQCWIMTQPYPFPDDRKHLMTEAKIFYKIIMNVGPR